jgi:hypothetical protein
MLYIFFNDAHLYFFSLGADYFYIDLQTLTTYDFFYFNIDNSILNTSNFKEYLRDYFILTIKTH